MSLTVFLNMLNKYISNISNTYNPNVNMRLSSQTKCEKCFPDLGFGSYILTFLSVQLRTWFIYFSSRMW